MTRWKLTIFVNAIRTRTKQEERTAEELIQVYTKLTNEEKEEILSNI